ncbi:MAG: bifunctional 4-hydroxy-2-oxoglutarate aldolase/2-dehydro-3-deoxy-phosphogluconate aldolase [Methylobacteriaceae bacterium]|jgi:2-dehydro-3-deoxyphosphogluconate aldolase/(4S)-4-hydroxy-2-oxoglutarate aldolase|nr:bifunctional 4-hydroxy-2-oxoglutarate aldolase/2-dehydro-3-deoxy-phosphogluconate aldolase [Methylobacteriaceae bacterium]
MLKQHVIEVIEKNGIIAIARGSSTDEVLAVAEALHAGGIRVFEVTCNSPGFLDSIKALKESFGDRMQIGAGTVTNPVLAELVLQAGADFVLAPDFDPAVIAAVHEKKRLMIPSVTTPTEVIQAHRLGVDLLKLFPASGLGPSYLKDLLGPFPEAALIPVGGISLDNLAAFARAGAFAFGVGGSLLKKTWIDGEDWAALSREAEKYVAAFKENRRK